MEKECSLVKSKLSSCQSKIHKHREEVRSQARKFQSSWALLELRTAYGKLNDNFNELRIENDGVVERMGTLDNELQEKTNELTTIKKMLGSQSLSEVTS